MPSFSAKIVDNEILVEERLLDFGLVPDQIIAVANIARNWATDASPLMPTNAPGTLAYIYGVNELRNQILNDAWKVDRTCGVEAVINRELRVRIGYQNVDRACDPIFGPMPRSAKGTASEALSGPTLFEASGVETGPLTGVLPDGVPTYYVMVGEDGSVELSHPVISNGTYKEFIERIFVKGVGPDWSEKIDSETGPVNDFDITVKLKD